MNVGHDYEILVLQGPWQYRYVCRCGDMGEWQQTNQVAMNDGELHVQAMEAVERVIGQENSNG